MLLPAFGLEYGPLPTASVRIIKTSGTVFFLYGKDLIVLFEFFFHKTVATDLSQRRTLLEINKL